MLWLVWDQGTYVWHCRNLRKARQGICPDDSQSPWRPGLGCWLRCKHPVRLYSRKYDSPYTISTWLDLFWLQRVRTLPKSSVQFVPGYGQILWALECAFLSRNFAKDEDTIRNTCEVYRNYPFPIVVILYCLSVNNLQGLSCSRTSTLGSYILWGNKIHSDQVFRRCSVCQRQGTACSKTPSRAQNQGILCASSPSSNNRCGGYWMAVKVGGLECSACTMDVCVNRGREPYTPRDVCVNRGREPYTIDK